MKRQDLIDYIFLALAWGVSFLVVVKVAEVFGWMGAVTFRSFIAGVVLWLTARFVGRKLDFNAPLLAFIIVGATTVAGQLIGLSYAAPRIGTAMSAIFVATIPLFSMLISQLWGHEMMTRQRVIGLCLGFCGMILLVGFPAVPVDGTFVMGCLAMLFSTVSAAFGSNYVSRYLRGTGSWEVTIGAFLSAGLMTLPLMLVVPVVKTPGFMDFVYLLILGCVMSALTYARYFRLVHAIGATRSISVEFMVTVVAVFIGAVLLQEPITALQIVGSGVIILGCALVLGLLPLRLFRTKGV